MPAIERMSLIVDLARRHRAVLRMRHEFLRRWLSDAAGGEGHRPNSKKLRRFKPVNRFRPSGRIADL
jgi:hypothetical protein